MSVSLVQYDLRDGYIDHWLAAGPQAIPLVDGKETPPAVSREDLALRFYDAHSGIHQRPVEPGPLEEAAFKIGSFQGEWGFFRCREDHFVDHSGSFSSPNYLRSWAYTQLLSPADQQAELTLTAFGPFEVWLNKASLGRFEDFPMQAAEVRCGAALKAGENEILVRFEGAALPECTLAVSLRVTGEGLSVQIPTLIPSLERRAELEAINQLVYLNSDVYSAEDHITVNWPERLAKPGFQDVRLQTPSGRIYAQAEDVGKPGESIRLSSPQALIPGPYHAYVMPRQWEMYDKQIRVTQTLRCWVLGRYRFSSGPYGTPEGRRGEALQHALTAGDDLYAQIARMALGRWEQVEAKTLTQAFADIRQQPAGSRTRLLGLLGALGRYGEKAEFPRWIKKEIKACALEFPYQKAPVEEQEGAQLVALACELLAGQLFPDATFGAGGLTGRQQRKQAEARVLAWMQVRAARGFDEWDSDEVYADSLMALSCLVDVARAEPVWELASVLMDKLFFSLALNSFRGVFGTSRGRGGSYSVRSGLLDATSGITRLMWGMGIWNQHVAALVNLACMRQYELPPILADIAAGLPGEIWDREQQGAGERRVNKVTYRTPDAMLSSAQDYRPGQPGGREQVWQATLGPQCVVFTSHPGCSAEVDAHAPNYWLGNGVLPRVVQWKDTLIALYNLPAGERMGFTHAYFPTAHFDEYALQGNTAFARKGDGYLAISASQGLELIMEGRTAFRELRSAGKQNAWMCQVGRAVLDGDFASFQQKVLAQETRVDGLRLEVHTLRGETLSLDWSGPFRRDGAEQALEGFPHFDNPYTSAEFPCRQMEIKTDDYLLRLDFSESA